MAGLLRNTEPALRAGWHPVCRADELGGEPLPVQLLGAWWELRRTGGAVEVARGVAPAGLCEASGMVWLAPEEPAAALLDAPEVGDATYVDGWLTPRVTTAAAGLYLDNQLDASHFPFVHTTTFGDEADPRVPDYDVELVPGGFTASVAHAFRNVLDPGVTTGQRSVEQVRRVSYRFALPLQLQLRIDHLQTGQRTVILFATTPRAEGCTALQMRILRNDVPGHEGYAEQTLPETLAFEDRVVEEDLALQERFDLPGLPLEPGLEVPVRTDRCGLELRRALRALCAARAPGVPAAARVAA